MISSENSFRTSETGSYEHYIKLKYPNYKRNLILDLLKILLISLFSLIFLYKNYESSAKSLNHISEIYKHYKCVQFRPSTIKYQQLFLLRKLEEDNINRQGIDSLITIYREKVLNNENEIFKSDLPWGELKKYSDDFKYIHFNDLCLSIYQAKSDFKEIIG